MQKLVPKVLQHFSCILQQSNEDQITLHGSVHSVETIYVAHNEQNVSP